MPKGIYRRQWKLSSEELESIGKHSESFCLSIANFLLKKQLVERLHKILRKKRFSRYGDLRSKTHFRNMLSFSLFMARLVARKRGTKSSLWDMRGLHKREGGRHMLLYATSFSKSLFSPIASNVLVLAPFCLCSWWIDREIFEKVFS